MSVAAQAYPMPDETPRIVIRAEDHFGLAIEVAKKYARRRRGQMLMDTDEFSDALLGLTIAIQTFDQERKIEFSTWAHICMSRQIIHHGRSRKRAERLPTESIERMSRRDVVEIPDYRGGNHTLPTWLIEKFFAPHPEDSEKDARCKQIVYDYYMKDMTLEEIGAEMKITKERVRQLKAHAEALLHERFDELVQEEMASDGKLPAVDE